MMKITSSLSALLVVYISMASCTPVVERPGSDVEAPVSRFIDFYFHSYKRGLPEKSQLPELASFLAPDFLDLFDAALRGEECYLKEINYEGPSPIQGDLFSSLFEGATSATYRAIVQNTDRATVDIEWTNDTDDGTSSPPVVWKDQIFLVKTRNGWLISDFAHLGTWEFMMKGNVSEILRSVAKECAP